VEVDSRDNIGRKFFQRCGFLVEAILRKHKIINERNRDTALFVILNSEWDDTELKLKKYLGWPIKVKGENVFAIPEPSKVMNAIISKSVSKDIKQQKKTKKRNKK
jgi:hypothetical protein